MSLEAAMNLDGALGAALVDLETGSCLPSMGSEPNEDLSLAALGNARMLRAQMRLAQEQKSSQKIEDLLITFEDQYYLIRPVRAAYENGSVFLFLVMDRKRANLALGRRKMAELEESIAQRMQLDERRAMVRKGDKSQSAVEAERPAFMSDDHVMHLLGIGPGRGEVVAEAAV